MVRFLRLCDDKQGYDDLSILCNKGLFLVVLIKRLFVWAKQNDFLYKRAKGQIQDMRWLRGI